MPILDKENLITKSPLQKKKNNLEKYRTKLPLFPVKTPLKQRKRKHWDFF